MKLKIGVLGDFILDKFIYYKATRLSPEGPVPIVEKINEITSAGGSGNVSLSLENLNLDVELYYPYSEKLKKDFYEEIEYLFKKSSIKLKKLNLDIKSPIKTRHYVDNRLFMREDQEIKYDPESSLIDEALITKCIQDSDILVVSDYQKGFFSIDTLQLLINKCNEFNKPIFVDSKNKDPKTFFNCFCLKVNELEFSYLAEASGLFKKKEKEISEKAGKFREKYNISNLVVTLGSKGSIVANKSEITSSPAIDVEINDITGAGDAFISALVKSSIDDPNFRQNFKKYEFREHNLKFSNEASSSVITFKGTKPIQKNFLFNRKSYKRFGKLGFTNGCFDILHIGHISLLKQAKEKCDYLIVGLNSDSSVRDLKGPDRPINKESSRKQILQALQYVDEVIVFAELTPINLIKDISPDFLIKGADYDAENIVGSDYVKSYGGKVIRVNLIEGVSSTKIMKNIRDNI